LEVTLYILLAKLQGHAQELAVHVFSGLSQVTTEHKTLLLLR